MIYGTSFSKLLEEAIQEYTFHIKNNDFEEDLTDDQHSKYQDELHSLLDELKNRVFDKYGFQVLRVSIPNILKDKNFTKENAIRDLLNAKLLSIKERFKKNGYCAIYAILLTPDNRKIEIQFQTYSRFKDSKIGRSDHSLYKQFDISHFFELKNYDKSDANYEKIFRDAINILDNTTIAVRNRLLSTPIESLSNEDKKLKRKLEAALKIVQLKETYENINTWKSEDGVEHTQTYTYSLDEYLPIFAEYHSPELVAVSSTHSRVNENIAFVNRKYLIDNFREKLLKADETTCLADMLIQRLQDIEKKNANIILSKDNIRKILENQRLPQNIIDNILMEMENQSKTTRFPYTNSINDIRKRTEEDQR